MRKIIKSLILCSALLAASCTKDDTRPQQGARCVILTGVATPESKTEFAGADNRAISFAWNPTDRIWVNDQRSSLVQPTDNDRFAEFIFDELVGNAPYKVYYNMAGVEAGKPYDQALIATEQSQSAAYVTNLGANGNFAYAVTDANGSFTLNHLPAYVWFAPLTQDITDNKLVSITLAVDDPDVGLAGEVSFTDGRLGRCEGSPSVSLRLGTAGFEVPAEHAAREVYAAMVLYPADLTGKTVTITYRFADGGYIRENKSGVRLVSGATLRIETELSAVDIERNVFFSTDDGTTWTEEVPASFTKLTVRTEDGDVVTADHHAAIFAAMSSGAELDFSQADNHSEVFGTYYRTGWSLATTHKLKSIVLPQNITELFGERDRGALQYCGNLESVILPAGLKTIGQYALHTTSKLTSVDLPASVNSIGTWAFYSSGITAITIPEGVETLESNTFAGCTRLVMVNLPASLTALEGYVFSECSVLKNIQLPNDLETLGSYAFNKCIELEQIMVPAGITTIAANTFYNCTNLKTVVLQEGLTAIGEQAFNNCPLSMLSLPSTVDHIGVRAFYNLPNHVKKLHLDVIEIGNYAFWSDQSMLESVTFGPKLTSMGTNAFINSKNLSKIVFQSAGCPSMTSTGIFQNAGENMPEADRKIYVPEGSTASYLSNPVIQYLLTTRQFTLEEGNGLEVLPDGVYFSETGEDGSWYDDFNTFKAAHATEYLYAKTIGSAVLTAEELSAIENYVETKAVLMVVNLSEARYVSTTSPDNLFGGYAGNPYLFELWLPWNIEEVGAQTAAYCKELRALFLGAHVQTIRQYTATPPMTNDKRVAIICEATTPPILHTDDYGYGWPFEGFMPGTVLPCYVPDASVGAYNSSSTWSNVSGSVEIKPLTSLTDYFWRSDL